MYSAAVAKIRKANRSGLKLSNIPAEQFPLLRELARVHGGTCEQVPNRGISQTYDGICAFPSRAYIPDFKVDWESAQLLLP